jgi:hypothetical protein
MWSILGNSKSKNSEGAHYHNLLEGVAHGLLEQQ